MARKTADRASVHCSNSRNVEAHTSFSLINNHFQQLMVINDKSDFLLTELADFLKAGRVSVA
jgi:hypothetical protein